MLDENQKPAGGKWSFDQENRKKIPCKDSHSRDAKANLSKYHDEASALSSISTLSEHPGFLDNPWFPVTRKEANEQFLDFIRNRMSNFGIYEDAMLRGSKLLVS